MMKQSLEVLCMLVYQNDNLRTILLKKKRNYFQMICLFSGSKEHTVQLSGQYLIKYLLICR